MALDSERGAGHHRRGVLPCGRDRRGLGALPRRPCPPPADAGHEIAAAVGDAAALEAAVHEEQPDLAIADIRMPPDNNDDGARVALIRGDLPTSLRFSSSRSTSRRATPSTSSAQGGFGYLLKDRILDVDDFLDSLAGSRAAAPPSTPRSSAAC